MQVCTFLVVPPLFHHTLLTSLTPAQGGTPASFLPFPSAPPNATGMLPPPYPMPGMMPGMPHPGAPLMHMPGGPMHGMFPPPGVEHGGTYPPFKY